MIKVEQEHLDRIQRISKITGFVSFGVFIALLIISVFSLNRINQDVSNKQAQVEELDARIANKNSLLVERDKLISEQSNIIVDTYKEIPNNVNKSTSNSIKKIFKNNPDVALSLSRIYLHIGDESQREPAKRWQKMLQDKGFIVPGIENVENKAPLRTELRYCQNKFQSDVDMIKSFFDAEKISLKEISNIQGCGIRAYEIWFGDDFKGQPKEEKQPAVNKKELVPMIDYEKLRNKKS